MSRREDRSSDARRHRSLFDREPSPKRSRRDDKLESERPSAAKLDKDRDSDQKHHRRLRDPLPLESSLAHDSKIETRTVSKDIDNRINGPQEGTKRSSDPTKVPQSRSYFQHDERGSAGQNGRSFARRTDKEHGWWRDSKDGRTEVKTVASKVKDEKSKDIRDEDRVWRHDGYFQMEANQKPPTRKRPAFREQRAPADPEKTNTTSANPVTPKLQDHAAESGRRDRDERRFNNSERPDRPERSFAREREMPKGEPWSNSRDRYGGVSSSRYRGGRERFNARHDGYWPAGGRVEKWKHDLYDEANKSPNPKNEEDQISKIEALLAS